MFISSDGEFNVFSVHMFLMKYLFILTHIKP